MSRPLILSTWSFGARGNARAWPNLARGGSSLDAVETVCRVVELDREVDSVGYGGLPDREGNVTLDGCVMLSPDRCGSVCAVRRFLHPVSIARRVMEQTPHIMLAGDGADAFAQDQGFEEADLLAEDARAKWLQWKRRPEVVDQSRDRGYAPPRPRDTGTGGRLFNPDEEDRRRESGHDTISALALDTDGLIAGACSSSGLPYKLPGRVGDSPIFGHGLYVDPTAGAAAATGAGELISGLCSSFLAVEEMRRGASPADALREALNRYPDAFELRDEHQVAMIALSPDGRWASGALKSGYRTSITQVDRSEVVEPDFVVIEK